MTEQEQWFIGLCRVGSSARGVCLDMIGQTLTTFTVTWSVQKLRHFLHAARQAAQQHDIEVVVGIEAESLENDSELGAVLANSGVRVLPVERWMVDALWRSHKRRRQTALYRAQCIAQVLVIAECPPRPLRQFAGPLATAAQRFGWQS